MVFLRAVCFCLQSGAGPDPCWGLGYVLFTAQPCVLKESPSRSKNPCKAWEEEFQIPLKEASNPCVVRWLMLDIFSSWYCICLLRVVYLRFRINNQNLKEVNFICKSYFLSSIILYFLERARLRKCAIEEKKAECNYFL